MDADSYPTSMKLPSVSVFFPAYNEAGNIETTVQKAIEVLKQLQFTDYEIIIVDDGSTDETAELSDALAAGNQHIRVIHHSPNRGYGGALKSGFAAAKYDWIAFTDADGQFEFADIARFLPYMTSYDAILGYRINRQDSATRVLNAKLWGWLMKALFGFRVRDIDCAFKLIRAEVYNAIPPLEADGAFISTELIAKLTRGGCRLIEVGVSHHPRVEGESTGANIRVILRAFKEAIKLRTRV